MAEIRRVRPWILGGVLLLAAGVAFHRTARSVERKVIRRIESTAERLGVRITYRDLRVGIFPPFRMTDLVINKPGQWISRIDRVSVSPRFWGPRGFGLLGRVRVEKVSLILPGDLAFRFHPTVWEVDPEHSATLKGPVQGLTLTTGSGPKGQILDIKASHLEMDRVGAFVLEGATSRDLGLLDGEAHAEGDPRREFKASWRFGGLGATTTGSAAVIPEKRGTSVELRATVERLAFRPLLNAFAVDLQNPAEDLGSLSGTLAASGLLSDPETLEVEQNFAFAPPPKAPLSVSRLRGSFVHEVTTNEGAKKKIHVSPDSPQFTALSEVPPLFVRALLIAEDAAFFSHPGIDLSELPKTLAVNWERGDAARGGSTITQQLAKNLFLTREKSLHRKLQELSYSFLLESTLGKQRILEIYLNIIEWGPGLYGLKPAARHYFDKEPWALSPKEVAVLVSLIPGPVKYQRSIQGGELRRGFETLVKNLLVKLHSVDAISEEEYQAALSEKLVFRGYAPEPEDPGGASPNAP